MKVVLDTNVLISGIFWKGLPYTLLQAWAASRFEVIVSKDILEEYFAVLHRIDGQGDIAKRWSVFLVEHANVVKDRYHVNLARDIQDNKFISTALSGGADFIVSGDDDLLSLQKQSPVPIIRPRNLISLLHKHYYGA